MFEEKVNKIIESVLQNRSFTETGRTVKETDLIIVSLAELRILADLFNNFFSETLKSFAGKLFYGLDQFNNQGPSPVEREKMERDIIDLIENNKGFVAYLNALNRLLISGDYDQTSLEALSQSYNFSLPKDQNFSGKDQYIEKLAESYIKGNTSATIQYLLKTSDNFFLEHAGFINDVKAAARITEREQLKKNMQFLDELEDSDMPGSEIKAAMALLEREQLSEVMKKIDAEEGTKVHLADEGFVPHTEKIKARAQIIPLAGNKFNWKAYAVAASIIGVIAATTIIIFNNREKQPGIAHNNAHTSDTTGIKKQVSDDKKDFAGIKWDSSTIVLPVKKETGLGFAGRVEKITVHVYRLKENDKIDSLQHPGKTYTFKNNILSLYGTDGSPVQLFKIGNTYYMEIAGIIYHIQSADKPAPLGRVTGKDTLTRIDKIKYQQGR